MRRAWRNATLTAVTLAVLWLLSPLSPVSTAWGAPGPHGGYAPTADTCAACHGAHTAQGEQLLAPPETDNAFCYACHDGTGAPATPILSTHSNIDFTGAAEESFTLSCVSCHEPHGSSNLFAIREYPEVESSTPITVGPVIFLARTGPNSFDDGTSATSSRLCVSCHESPDNQGFPMTDHVGAANHQGGISYEGDDCIGCHPHSADGTRENLDGFMPVGGCTLCHGTAQDNGDGVPVGGRRAVIPDFETNSHHVQGTVGDIDCVACHEMTQHQQGQVRLKNADTGAVTALAERPDDNPTVAALLEPWCLACHDADGAGGSAPFADGIMPPIIDSTRWGAAKHSGFQTCYSCHRNGHGSAYSPIAVAQYTTTDNTPYNPAEYQLCFDCHDENKLVGPLNAFSDYHSEHVADPPGFPCAHCHDPHYPYDFGESGLIYLDYPDINLQGNDLSSAFVVNATQGTCYLECHGKQHGEDTWYTRINPGQTTGCAGCHSTPIDNGDGVPVGGRRAVLSDFEKSSHHVQGSVSDADCLDCHDMTNHQAGLVILKDADGGAPLTLTDRPDNDPAVAASLEPWCLACHDADGAGGSAPFSDGIMPPNVTSVWTGASSHNSGPSVDTCWDCHDQGHGSNKTKLLAPWDAVADAGSPDDPLHQEEGFCFQCHASTGPASTDIAGLFDLTPIWVTAPVGDFSNMNLNDRHDVQASVQAVSGGVIECVSCHDPHAASAAQKVILDPDPTDGRVPGSGFLPQTGGDYMTEWCLDCHDGTYSAHVTPPTTQLQDVYLTIVGEDGAGRRADAMGMDGGRPTLRTGYGWVEDMIVPCLSCHNPHVSTNFFHVTDTVYSFDGSTPVPPDGSPFAITDNNIQDATVNGYNWCNTCHTGSMGSGKDNCFDCHYHGTRW